MNHNKGTQRRTGDPYYEENRPTNFGPEEWKAYIDDGELIDTENFASTLTTQDQFYDLQWDHTMRHEEAMEPQRPVEWTAWEIYDPPLPEDDKVKPIETLAQVPPSPRPSHMS